MPASRETASATPDTTWNGPRHRSTVRWVVLIAAIAVLFDGYDLVVYGTVLPTLLADPTALGELTPGQAGALGSYALVGVMVGALIAGAVGDRVGRRRMMIINIVWFSVGMGLTAMATSVVAFGVLRFVTGLGVGALVATAGAVVAEFAPPGRRNLYNAIVYSGIPAGGVMASLLAILLQEAIGWRGLFWIGALPLVILLPVALAKLPESPRWLLSRGRDEEAARVAERTGVPLPSAAEDAAERDDGGRSGFALLASRPYLLPTALLGMMSFAGLLLTYGLNTWLPQIMGQAGFDAQGSLAFLLILNGGAILGGLYASYRADRTHPQRIIAVTFGLAALSLVVLTLGLPVWMLLAAVAMAGVGTIGTQVLVYGFVSNYYPTSARAAGVAWCAGFGRLGGILGPLVGGVLMGAGLSSQASFYVFAGIAVLGAAVTWSVPREARRAAAVASPEVTGAASAASRDNAPSSLQK
ncbi:MFS transporter [Nocardiopsis salina]|uniref:MFS transporter n=1 Tax=Nocardiopsis salina TaxID=245836 RepID=UPI00034CD165|nr:aromatic acid/H+ symport family MFS transporter [Nocardiopsis salina]